MKKLKTKIKSLMFKLSLYASFILVVAFLLDCALIKAIMFIQDPVPQSMPVEITVPRKKIVKEIKVDIKEYVLNEVAKAGLNVKEADCLIQNESGWNNWRYNINNDGTTDFGLWQWNSVHKDISVECRWDYKCATKKAIEKRLKDGNWDAWYGFRKCNLANL